MVVPPSSILLTFGSALAVGIFLWFYPASRAVEMDRIKALRYELHQKKNPDNG